MSQTFAKQYNLPFPLIEDKEQKLSLAYVGVDDDGFSVPGLVVVAPGGKIALRQTGEAPGDRIYAADLLKVVDDMIGDQAARGPGVQGGYAPLERIQLRLGAALGVARAGGSGDGLGLSTRGELAALYPISRNLMLGGLVRGLAVNSTRLDVDASIKLRLPILYDNGEAYVHIPIGLAVDVTNDDADPNQRTGLNTGAALGIQFALKPSLGIYLEAAATYHRFSGRDDAEALTELRFTGGGGVGFLF